MIWSHVGCLWYDAFSGNRMCILAYTWAWPGSRRYSLCTHTELLLGDLEMLHIKPNGKIKAAITHISHIWQEELGSLKLYQIFIHIKRTWKTCTNLQTRSPVGRLWNANQL